MMVVTGENFAQEKAMQSNCNGSSVVSEQAKKNNGFRKQGGKRNLNFPALAEREM